MISKDEEKAFYEIMGGLGEEADKIEAKVDSLNKTKVALLVILSVVGIITMIVGVATEILFVGVLGFIFMFAGGYFISKIFNI